MRNFEQIRAANAFEAATSNQFKGKNGGASVVKKVPTQIRENGFLGALAFAIEKNIDNTPGYKNVFEAIMKHLPSVNCDFGINCNGEIEDFFSGLSTKRDADVLRAITSESMAYLNYLRRFAKDSEENK